MGSIYTKENPVGIDEAIQKCQTRLGDELPWDDFHVYGRLYLNKNIDKKITAEAHTKNNAYGQIFIDRSKGSVFGFVEDGTRQISSGRQQSTVLIVGSVVLTKLYDTTERKDEEALLEVVKIVNNVGGWKVEEAETRGVDKVFSFMNTDQITFRDMQPFANFSIKCTVSYRNSICKTRS